MSKRRVCLFFTLAGIVFLTSISISAQYTDPFYVRLLDKAQKAFLAKNYQDAARDFEIAAFGLMRDTTLQAKAKVYLGLCRYYLEDIQGAEKSLREAADLMGDQGFAPLEVYESARPDLDRLVSFFNLTGSQNEAPAPKVQKPLPSNPESRSANPGEPAKKPEEKPGKAATEESVLNIDEVKQGDLLPLDLVDTRPTLIKSIPAVYPAYARPLRIEGTVILNALISEKGKVIDTEVVEGIKNAVGFDQAAQKAVRQWKFEPASIKGIKVKVWMPVAVEFKRSSNPSG